MLADLETLITFLHLWGGVLKSQHSQLVWWAVPSSCWSLHKNNFHRLLIKFLKSREMRWSMEVLRVCVVCLSLCVSVISAFSQSLDSDFTFTLPAGRKECFFQTMKKDASLEIEYQVHLEISLWSSLYVGETGYTARRYNIGYCLHSCCSIN